MFRNYWRTIKTGRQAAVVGQPGQAHPRGGRLSFAVVPACCRSYWLLLTPGGMCQSVHSLRRRCCRLVSNWCFLLILEKYNILFMNTTHIIHSYRIVLPLFGYFNIISFILLCALLALAEFFFFRRFFHPICYLRPFTEYITLHTLIVPPSV